MEVPQILDCAAFRVQVAAYIGSYQKICFISELGSLGVGRVTPSLDLSFWSLRTRWPGPPSDETHNITVATTKWPLACNSQARRKQQPHQWPPQPRACYSQARQTPTEPPQPRGFKPATVRRDKRRDCCKCQSYSQACYSQARHPSCDGWTAVFDLDSPCPPHPTTCYLYTRAQRSTISETLRTWRDHNVLNQPMSSAYQNVDCTTPNIKCQGYLLYRPNGRRLPEEPNFQSDKSRKV